MQIHQVKIKNYRSLKDVNIGDLSNCVIFYGDNDTGKSNILSFLEIIFKPKFIKFESQSRDELLEEEKPSGFWSGQINDFKDNYFYNTNEPIGFTVILFIENKEIEKINNLPNNFISLLPGNKNYSTLELEGIIESNSSDTAFMSLINSEFNQKSFYKKDGEKVQYLPSYSELSEAEKKQVFDNIMNELSTLFFRIPPDRFFANELEMKREANINLTPEKIKNWLFKTMHNRDSEYLFNEIKKQFSEAPFEEGEISVLRVDENNIEIFTEDKHGFKLPIGRRGSGVQQILMILSYIANSKSPIIGIEELEINLSPNTQKIIFNKLFNLLQLQDSPVKQIFLTTHSPHIAKRNEAQRRFVSMDDKGQTEVCKPSESEIEKYFFI